MYDDDGRPASWNLLNAQVAYLYEDGSKNPFAKISFSWTPYTSDDYAVYGNDTEISLFQPE